MLQGILAAVGLATTAYSLFKGNDQAKQQNVIAQQQAYTQTQINNQQRAALQEQQKVADIQYQQTVGQIGASKEVVAKQQELESIKRQSAVLDATRRKREAVRDMIIAKSTSLASAVGKGVSTGDTSVSGGRAQAENRGGSNVLGINQALGAGLQAFDINQLISQIYLQQQEASLGYLGQSYAAETATRQIQGNVFSLNSQQSTLASQSAVLGSKQATTQGIGNIGISLLQGAGPLSANLQSGFSSFGNLFKT